MACNWTVEFYETETGEKPSLDLILNRNPEAGEKRWH